MLSMRSHSLVNVILPAVMIVSLCGCGVSETPAGLSTYDGSGYGKGGNMSELSGTFVNEDGCLLIEDEAGIAWIPLFPEGKATDRGTKITYGPLSLGFDTDVSVPGAEATQLPEGTRLAAACSDESRLWLLPVF